MGDHLFSLRLTENNLCLQVICDANLRFLDVDASWPGQTHDSFMFRNGHVGMSLEDGDAPLDMWLLGEYLYRQLDKHVYMSNMIIDNNLNTRAAVLLM